MYGSYRLRLYSLGQAAQRLEAGMTQAEFDAESLIAELECVVQFDGKDAMVKYIKGNDALKQSLLVKCESLRKQIKHYEDIANLIGRLT
jgi:hypothetical protein